MGKLIDLTGMKFGRWTVLEKAPPAPNSGGAYWICKCDCGTVRPVNSQSLRNGETKSCGCYHYESLSNNTRTHGKSKTRLYNIWSSMRERCYCKTSAAYKYYGEKGITICDEWKDFSAFEKWALENGYDQSAKPHQCTIDRIDNANGYSPSNCRWADSTIQSNNQTSNIIIDYCGEKKTLAEWAKDKGLRYSVIYNRIVRYGWDVERAMTEPPREWSPGKCKKSA